MAVRSVLKALKLSKNMWNIIEEEVIYIKNRIIIINESDNEIISFFENVNDVFSDVLNLRTLNCKVYIHIFKTFNRHKLNNRCWKSIHVDYDKNNQWKIYNSRTRTMHLIRNVRFDRKNIFYNEIINASQNFENFDKKSKMIFFWNFENDSLLNVHSRRNWLNKLKKV